MMKKRLLLKAWIIATLLLCWTFDPVVAGEKEEQPEDKWTPKLSMKYKSIRGTAMSPDGKWIAYVVREAVMEGEKSEYLSHIWVVSSDGSSDAQYTRGEKSASNPSFSPAGKHLAFTSARTEKNQVWVMRIRGGEAEQVTEAKSGVDSYQWSPDGKYIAYTMKDPETEEEEKAKKEKRDVILVDQNFKYNHLYKVPLAKNADGKRETKRLTAGEFHIISFDWSPDGKNIVFSHKIDPRINTSRSGTDISVVPADSGEVKHLVARPGADRNPEYSPDGKSIAFISHGGQPENIGLGDLYLVSAAGGTPEKLTETPDRNIRSIDWSSDGKHIFVTESFRTSRHVFTIPVDGNELGFITSGDGIFSSLSFNDKTNQMTFIYQDLGSPAEVYTSPVKKLNMKKLTAVNANVSKPKMAKTELLKWKSEDGLEIEGLLTYPVDYEKGRAYPLILNVHGGPAGVYTQSFTGNPAIYMIQYFAQQGYAILRANPRGSTGYGKDFRYANFKDWGFGDYEDIMSGVDKVIDMGVGHPDSLCLMGWSYGGYMTSYAVTKTNRFKAASMGAGLPNLISMTMTTDIPDYLVAHMGGEFWEDYETYEKHSAIYRIKNVTTPTQVIHGAEDLRVPFTQGQEFYVALSRLGVPTEMVVYPRTPHGPREPKFLMDVSDRILIWFEKHLGRGKPTELTAK
ncbi:S9 family peptidase [candidate division KSB1 bacterium]|nr:S9 family peptidase [candidate division KSB1 bacterium]